MFPDNDFFLPLATDKLAEKISDLESAIDPELLPFYRMSKEATKEDNKEPVADAQINKQEEPRPILLSVE